MAATVKTTVTVAVGTIEVDSGERVAVWAQPKEMELIRLAFAGGPAAEVDRLRAECAQERSGGAALDNVVWDGGGGR